MYKPGYGDRYEDERYEGHYGNRDEDRNGYGREREYGYRDDDRYGRYGDPYNRDGDRYGRDYEERYSRDGYRDDDYRGRSHSLDGHGPRSRSADIDRDRGFDDDGQSSSRGSGARADDQSLDGRRLERKFSEQNIGAPPCYEEAVGDSRSPAYGERNRDTSAPFAPGASSSLPPRASSPPAPKAASPHINVNPSQATPGSGISSSPVGQESEVADEFDPRGPVSAIHIATAAPTVSSVPTASNNVEVDLLGSMSDSFAPNPLAIMPVTSATTSEAVVEKNFSGSTFDTTQATIQPFEDPFGDTPFKAIPSMDNVLEQQQIYTSLPPHPPTLNQNAEVPLTSAPNPDTVNDFGGTFSATGFSASNAEPLPTNSQFLPQELSSSQEEIDILAGILPPSGSSSFTTSHAGFLAPTSQPVQPSAGFYENFNAQGGTLAPVVSNIGPQAQQFSGGNFLPQAVSTAPNSSITATQTPAGNSALFNNGNLLPQQGSAVPVGSHFTKHTATGPTSQLNNGCSFPQQGFPAPAAAQLAHHTQTVPSAQHNSEILGNSFSQGTNTSMVAQPALTSSTGSLTIIPQPAKDKFETKSTIWIDTLSRGLVNLNISGPKINPLSDIGIDFDAINRKEKRMERPTASAVTSTVTMGKAMGSGSGIGRAGAGALRLPPNPTMGSGIGMGNGMGMGMSMGMGGGPGSGMGMGGYGGMNRPMGMGMGINMGMNMGMGMNVGMGQGGQMQPPGSTIPGGYNPMMGTGGYMPQQQYGGGYR
uniref:Clathrin interactor EPSIN 3 isoform X2 n=1 Tax=Rhizophora mucronata TaxID=61149 RepID=A0A2P2MFV1_RHIMU